MCQEVAVCDMAAGNIFLLEFLVRCNEKFAVRAARPEDLHRPVPAKADRLLDILCHRASSGVPASRSRWRTIRSS